VATRPQLLHESERAAVTFTRFAAGSLSCTTSSCFSCHSWSAVTALRPSGLSGLLQLPELSYAVGIVPLVAAFALFRRAMRRRTGEKPLGVWYALIIEGILLSAGANTPLGHVLVDIPLYGGQRLQNRNAVIVDIALAVLLAVFVDVLRPRAAAPGALPDPAADADSGLSFNERLAASCRSASWHSSFSPRTCWVGRSSAASASPVTTRGSPCI